MNNGHSFEWLFSLDNLLAAWFKFRQGKARKPDVLAFERHLEDNVFFLCEELLTGRYRHGGYERFIVRDSKKRVIYKAPVRDRLVHHIAAGYLSAVFEPRFIADSYSARRGKGLHRAVGTLQYFMRLMGGGRGFILKGDIKKFFENINQAKLLEIIGRQVSEPRRTAVIEGIVKSFASSPRSGRGLPLGNVTSQIFANIYLNELDQFVKRQLGIRFYMRYNDDFVMLAESERPLARALGEIREFLGRTLGLAVPADKVVFRRLSHGVEFLGYKIFPHFRLLRPSTKAKVVHRLKERNINSYLGLLEHADCFHLRQKLLADFFLSREAELG